MAAVLATAFMAVADAVKTLFNVANEPLFTEELFVATLDERTTPICRSLDGKVFPVGKGPHPPLHFNCRSIRVAVINGNALSERPAKPFTQHQLLNEFTQRQEIEDVATRANLPHGFKTKFDAFARRRIRELTGRVPGTLSYQEWLHNQSAEFQDEILGRARGALFRRGDLPLTKFVDRQGELIPLEQLAKRERTAFVRAGLNPDAF
jgi:hypothetical protein